MRTTTGTVGNFHEEGTPRGGVQLPFQSIAKGAWGYVMKKITISAAVLVCLMLLPWVILPSARAEVSLLWHEGHPDGWLHFWWVEIYGDAAKNVYFGRTSDDPSWKTYNSLLGDWLTGAKVVQDSTMPWDGQYHETPNSTFSYKYVDSLGQGIWHNKDLNLDQFCFTYSSGRWAQMGKDGTWQTLSGPYPVSSALANYFSSGSWYSLANGWWYQFKGDSGYWYNPSLNITQYSYNYSNGQWLSQGKYGAATLSAVGLSAAFLGDGTWHDLGNNWQYLCGGGDFGVWKNPKMDLMQYAYNYGTGAWYNQSLYGGWQTLGSSGLSSSFLGDGTWHDLANNWEYLCGGDDFGSWYNRSLRIAQYAYNYGTGQWFDQGLYGGWATLGSTGLSSRFVGDGAWHGLGTLGDGNWYFSYTPASVWGSFMNPVEGKAYIYDYNAGQMYYWNNGTWSPTGPNHYPPILGG
jgi:hypothetical protein